jgi:signal transduction histidine kinase
MPPTGTLLSRLPPAAADLALAIAVAVTSSVMDSLEPHGHLAGALILWDVALAAPLLLRRRRRSTAAAAIALVCLMQWLANMPTHGDLFVLLTLFTLGLHERRRLVLVTAAAVTEIGIIVAVARWSGGADAWLTALTYTGTAAASWLLGVYLGIRRDYLASVIDRAEAAERDRDLRAKIAVDAERARIARELHDIVSHSLSVMITLNDAAAAVSHPDDVRRAVVQAAEVGRQALSEMQRLLDVLREDGAPDFRPQPGLAQLPDLVAMLRSAGIAATLSITGEVGALTGSMELAIYRLVQESLTNVLKHARNVTTVKTSISCDAGQVVVRVHNDGTEVPRTPAGGSGHGLTGMQERATLFGGQVHAAPAEGGGWIVIAHLAGGGPDQTEARRAMSGAYR